MNHYRKKTFHRKKNFGRPNRRFQESFHQPLSGETIPYARHTLTKSDVEAVVDALLSGTLTCGSEVERFENLLAKLTHCQFAVAVNSGTAALHAALAAVGVGPGDEVILSTLNFCAAANMTVLCGATPVLVDIDPTTLTMDLEAVGAAVNDRTKVILANNFAGHPADMAALRELCNAHELVLIEDACHGLGGRYRGHYVGNQADLTCFSFHPSKAVTTAEGGAITTNDVSRYEWLKQFRHHGIAKAADQFLSAPESYADYYQELQFLGMNYRMSEIQAALGRSQLTRLDKHLERRRAIANYYFKALEHVPGITLPVSADWADHAYHLFVIQVEDELCDHRDSLFSMLREHGFMVQLHYIPLHRMPFYREAFVGQHFPNADLYADTAISLPMFPDLQVKDMDRLIQLLKDYSEEVLSSDGRDTLDDGPDDEGERGQEYGEEGYLDRSDLGYGDPDDLPEEQEDAPAEQAKKLEEVPEPPVVSVETVDPKKSSPRRKRIIKRKKEEGTEGKGEQPAAASNSLAVQAEVLQEVPVETEKIPPEPESVATEADPQEASEKPVRRRRKTTATATSGRKKSGSTTRRKSAKTDEAEAVAQEDPPTDDAGVANDPS
jgi:dTDP-4-amino-4,6-dideoxygalactose transaminase